MSSSILPSLTHEFSAQHPPKAYIVGLGLSGQSAMTALKQAGFDIFVYDDDKKLLAEATGRGAVALPPHDWQKDLAIDMLVLSPGIPFKASLSKPAHPTAQLAQQYQVPIRVDIDLLFQEWRHKKRDFIFITGTNGKSTTTLLTSHILQQNQLAIGMGGNIGKPALSLPVLPEGGAYILELSSYQIDMMPDPVPTVAVLLNLSYDHLERHDTMENYLSIKTKIFGKPQQKPSLSIIGVDDDYCRQFYQQHKNELSLIAISGMDLPKNGVGVKGNQLIDDRKGLVVASLPAHPNLMGPHNAMNLAASYIIADHYHIPLDKIISALESFTPLPHRQEKIAVIDGVAYVNDSKATNVHAVVMSLLSYHDIHWLAGGDLKMGDNLDALTKTTGRIVKGYFFGKGAKILQEHFQGKIPSQVFADLRSATMAAHHDAKKGVVLLSPVGASFDQYRNFEERGKDFKNIIDALKK